MRPRDLFTATVSPAGDAVLLTCLHAGKLQVLGGSVPIAGKHQHNLTSVAIVPQAGTPGVVAVAAFSNMGPHKGGEWFGFLLAVEMGADGKPHIDLDTPFIPSAERLGSADSTGVQVEIGDTGFTSFEYAKWTRNTRHVPDADLLCRYLVGQASADDVQAAAEATAAEISARELAEQRGKEIDCLLRKVKDMREQRVDLRDELAAVQRELQDAKLMSGSDSLTIKRWREAANELRRALTVKWRRGRAIRIALALFPDQLTSVRIR